MRTGFYVVGKLLGYKITPLPIVIQAKSKNAIQWGFKCKILTATAVTTPQHKI